MTTKRHKDIKREGTRAERWVKRRVGGILTPASGALQASLDIRSVKRCGKEFLLEVKLTSKDPYLLTRQTWETIIRRAEMRSMCPALCVVFRTRLGKKPMILLRKDDAPPHLAVEKEVTVRFTKNPKKELTLRARVPISPTHDITLIDWEGEKIVLLPLYRWDEGEEKACKKEKRKKRRSSDASTPSLKSSGARKK
jgi:hypothetical protein